MLPKKGDTVELISMNDPYPISPGEKGVVYSINPIGKEVQIGVGKWSQIIFNISRR